jgi:RNA polymerase sigma factor (sigma-70 family)
MLSAPASATVSVSTAFVATGTRPEIAVYGLRFAVEGRPLVDDDSELIRRAQRGEVMAYESLVRRYQDAAVRTAYVIAPDGDAEDAVQEAFVKAYAALGRFREGSPFRPWLLRIVANEARNRRRSAGRRAGLALRAAEDRRPGDAAPSPESAVLAGEERTRLLAAINELGEGDREVIAARYFLDLSEAETANVLGVPRGTVKSRLSRAVARLRARLVAANGATDHG